MIRINLLGVPKPKKGKRPAMPVSDGEGGGGAGLIIIGLLILVITVAGNAVWYLRLTNQSVKIQKDMAAANADYARLNQVKVRYEELEREKDAYKKRVDVIDDLQAKQSGPVNLLSMISETVNRSDEVWLKTMTDEGSSVNLKGVALSVHSVADFMHNLEKTGQFKEVEIKSSYQDESVKDMQAFQFELTCVKQLSQPPAVPAKKS